MNEKSYNILKITQSVQECLLLLLYFIIIIILWEVELAL